jgi:hypothetical protein
MPVELDGDEAWKLAAWAASPEGRRAKRDALGVAKRVQDTRNARYEAEQLEPRPESVALSMSGNGLHLPQPWELGHSYEQGDPGWYICSVPTGLVVLVLDDEIPITRSAAERVLAALVREFTAPLKRSHDETEPALSMLRETLDTENRHRARLVRRLEELGAEGEVRTERQIVATVLAEELVRLERMIRVLGPQTA